MNTANANANSVNFVDNSKNTNSVRYEVIQTVLVLFLMYLLFRVSYALYNSLYNFKLRLIKGLQKLLDREIDSKRIYRIDISTSQIYCTVSHSANQESVQGGVHSVGQVSDHSGVLSGVHSASQAGVHSANQAGVHSVGQAGDHSGVHSASQAGVHSVGQAGDHSVGQSGDHLSEKPIIIKVNDNNISFKNIIDLIIVVICAFNTEP